MAGRYLSEQLKSFTKSYPDMRDSVVEVVTDALRNHAEFDRALNANFVNTLVEHRALESLDVIEEAFEMGSVALDIRGDWEEVQIELRLISERRTPAPPDGWIAAENPEIGATFANLRQMLDRLASVSPQLDDTAVNELPSTGEEIREKRRLKQLRAKSKKKKKKKRRR